MDIKCKTNPYYLSVSSPMVATHFQGARNASRVAERVCANAKKGINAGLCEDIIVRRPVANKNATGLLGLAERCKNSITDYAKNYKKNIKHTFDHKIIFALIERKLFGQNSIDSVTHDLDKLVLYMFGFPKSFVSKIHRNISVHHTESGKKNNLRSMLCDNIASSPEFKPEKTKSLREHFRTDRDLQKVEGFSELLEKYNFGENLDFNEIKAEKDTRFNSYHNIAAVALNLLLFIYSNAKTSRL